MTGWSEQDLKTEIQHVYCAVLNSTPFTTYLLIEDGKDGIGMDGHNKNARFVPLIIG